MLLNAYTLFDYKALVYSPPFFVSADGAAVRMVQDLVNDNNTQVGRHPADFVLYCIGTFSDTNGSLEPTTPLRHIMDAVALVKVQQVFSFDQK